MYRFAFTIYKTANVKNKCAYIFIAAIAKFRRSIFKALYDNESNLFNA